MKIENINIREIFEQLRGDYPVRREFDSYAIQAKNISPDIVGKLTELGFKLVDAG